MIKRILMAWKFEKPSKAKNTATPKKARRFAAQYVGPYGYEKRKASSHLEPANTCASPCIQKDVMSSISLGNGIPMTS